MRPQDGPAPTPLHPRKANLTRRRWLLWAAGSLLAVPLATRQAHKIRQRLRGEPAPTGWFGHC